jgi:hypothetical protein
VFLLCYSFQTLSLFYSGLPDFTWHNIPKRVKIHQITTKLPNGRKICQLDILYSEWLFIVATFSIPKPSKSYPNCIFWFENIPSGNPVSMYFFRALSSNSCVRNPSFCKQRMAMKKFLQTHPNNNYVCKPIRFLHIFAVHVPTLNWVLFKCSFTSYLSQQKTIQN